MGIESYQLALQGGQFRPDDLARELLNDPTISRDQGFLSSSQYLLLDDGKHKIEMEIDRDASRLSMRFALCHPDSIDDVFLSLVRSYRSQFGMEFELPENEDERRIRQEIAEERMHWQMQFGTKTAAATTAEAFEWFIKPHCVPSNPMNGIHRHSDPVHTHQ